ncbi:MAG TPA: O-antigen ligase family protein [Gaiellaceae bacterium]|nr:O-antigen ligase family protein [Gaiellaceae bacterium]
MHAGLLRGAAALGPALLFGSGILVALALFAGDGSSYGSLVWIGALALVDAGILLALSLWGTLPWPRLDRAGLAFVVLLTALVVWIGLSVLWSVAPDHSWEYANRGLVYLAFLAIGLVVGATDRRPVQAAVAGLAVLLAAVMVWALAGKVIPSLFPDGARIARLREPIGYWNGLALLAAMALPVGLWLAVRREHHRTLRSAAVVLLFLSAVTLLLTYSRGGVVVALVTLAVYLALIPLRVEAMAALTISLPPAIALAFWAFSEPGLVENLQTYDNRVRAGAFFGVFFVLGAALVGAAAYFVTGREERWRPRFRWSLSGPRLAGGAAAALVVVVLAASGGHPVDWVRDGFREFTNPASEAGSGPGRLGNVSSNSRWTWWKEAWTMFEDEPVGGTGAASFAIARRPIRTNTTVATEPHNLALQFLGETGIAGFLLFAGAVVTAVLGVVGTIRRLDGQDAAAATALGVALLAYLLHALIDYDWDFVALTGPTLLLLGILLAAGRATRRRFRAPVWAAGAVLFAAAAVFSLTAPWLAARDVADAYAALDRDEIGKALDEAKSARALNPLAIEPLFATAAAEEARGDDRAALERYVQAVDLQPQNWRTWYELGRFELGTGRPARGLRHLKRARELDPLGPANDLLAAQGL